MPMRCGECRTAVDDTAETCPRCGAPRTQFRMAELPGGADAEPETARPASESGLGERRTIGTTARVWIGVTLIVVTFVAIAYYSKHSHLENVRRR